MNVDGVQLGNGDAVLTFRSPERDPSGGDYLAVELDVLALHVSQRVALNAAWASLSEFFAALAESWRGWEGPREWVSVERDLRLTCYHDRIGHVVVVVVMGLVPPHEWHLPGWSTTATVVVDPGALDAFAKAIREALDGR